MFSFLYVDSDLGYWYIIWKVNTKGGWIWETPFALICLCGLGFHGRPVAWVQVNRQRLQETVFMLPFHSCYIWGTWRSKEVRFNGGAKRGEQIGGLMLSYGGKGKATKRGTFMGSHKKIPRELTTELLYLELPTYFSLLWCNNIYALPT